MKVTDKVAIVTGAGGASIDALRRPSSSYGVLR